MFFTTGPNIARNKFLEDFPTSRGDSAVASFQSAAELNPLALISNYYTAERLGEEGAQPAVQNSRRRRRRSAPIEVSNRMMTQAEAREQAATDGFDDLEIPLEGMTELKYKFLKERKTRQRMRDSIMMRGPQDFTQGAINLGAGVLASIADPINVASAFIPAVGMTRMTRAFIQANQATGRGLHLAETAILARHGRFGTLPASATKAQRLTAAGKVGVIEGAIGAAAVEPLVFTLARGLQDDYDLADSAINIAFGSVLGGVLHVGGTAITGKVAGLPERAELFKTQRRLSPAVTNTQVSGTGYGVLLDSETTIQTREAAFRAAFSQTLEGRPVDVEDILRSEREILEYQRGKDQDYQARKYLQEKTVEIDQTVTRLKAKLRPGQAIEDADLAARSAEIEARVKELGERPALPALAKERARIAQEFNDIRDLRIAMKQMDSIKADNFEGVALPKAIRDEMDATVQKRMNDALTTEQVNQLAIDKITAAGEKAKRPSIANYDFKIMETEAARGVRQSEAAKTADAETRKVEADEEFTALVEDAEAVNVKLDDADIKAMDEAVAQVDRVNDAARAFAKCRAA